MRPDHADWIIRKDKETGTLRPCEDPASGGEWQIRAGNFVTLAEAFWFGKDLCSLCDVYRWYTTLDVWIQKRYHPSSMNETGMWRKEAKVLRHYETGKWGLPAPGRPWW